MDQDSVQRVGDNTRISWMEGEGWSGFWRSGCWKGEWEGRQVKGEALIGA